MGSKIEPFRNDLDHLQAALSVLDLRIGLALVNARAAGFDPADDLQGLYVDEAEVSRLLKLGPGAGLWDGGRPDPDVRSRLQEAVVTASQNLAARERLSREAGIGLRLVELADEFGLSNDERDVLLIALAPEIDSRYERLFAYLQDDVTRKLPTVNLAINLLGRSPEDRLRLRNLLTSGSILRSKLILDCKPDPNIRDTPFLSHRLVVEPRVADHLLGADVIDHRLRGFLHPVRSDVALEELDLPSETLSALRAAISEMPILYFYGPRGVGRREAAAALCAETGLPLLAFDLERVIASGGDSVALVSLAVREAHLARSALALIGWDAASADVLPLPAMWEALTTYPRPVFLIGAKPWIPGGLDAGRFWSIAFEPPDFTARLRHWERMLNEAERLVLDPVELANKFRLTRGQIVGAVEAARRRAARRGARIPSMDDFYAGSREQSTTRLPALARKIKPRFGWDDIVLPSDRIEQLREICDRVRYRHLVHYKWGFGRKIATEHGLMALFAGPSGTGKTMAAEIIARELGLELYKIDLSTVVSKYVGETEKNLEAIFTEAAAGNAILFFDEADALFGKRSEVKDAHDRYANIEIAYLLQRMEDYDGITILATNLRQNLDEAFTRRMDFLVDFPFPEAEDRKRIWQLMFPPEAPLSEDVDFDRLAENFRMTGGNIRNAALASAFLAAADGGMIEIRHILHAVRREHQKMGRLMSDGG